MYLQAPRWHQASGIRHHGKHLGKHVVQGLGLLQIVQIVGRNKKFLDFILAGLHRQNAREDNHARVMLFPVFPGLGFQSHKRGMPVDLFKIKGKGNSVCHLKQLHGLGCLFGQHRVGK